MNEKLKVGDFVMVDFERNNWYPFPVLKNEVGIIWYTADEFTDFPEHHRVFFAAVPSGAHEGLRLLKESTLIKC